MKRTTKFSINQDEFLEMLLSAAGLKDTEENKRQLADTLQIGFKEPGKTLYGEFGFEPFRYISFSVHSDGLGESDEPIRD